MGWNQIFNNADSYCVNSIDNFFGSSGLTFKLLTQDNPLDGVPSIEAPEEIIPLPCKCSIILGPTFVEIKKSFTKTLLNSNSKNFRIFFYWKKTDKSEPSFGIIFSIIFYHSLICLGFVIEIFYK